MKTDAEVLADWVEDLSSRLGRAAEAIRAEGLSAHDFSSTKSVKINFVDGSTAFFRYAFACVRKQESKVAVFSEHCGYMEFRLTSAMEVVEIDETYYCHE